MARVRYIGAEPVTVPELGSREVQPDEMVEVPDERFGGYVCQTSAWEPIEEPRDWAWPKTDEFDEPGQEAQPAAAPEPEPKTALKKTTPAAKAAASKEG
ncbi:hypothetical protein [Streptomyces sp. NPDC001741]|uniref:hypothetical protein n=1 Tax=Streptomyces sp. NPDC001741 TaxID=3364605 RepID=UPI00368CFC9A